MNKKLAIGLLLLIVALVTVPEVSAYGSTGWLALHPNSNPTPEECGRCHPAIAPSCTSCHSNPFTLTVKANPTTVTAGTTESVTFSVTRKTSTQAVNAVSVDLSGVAAGSGTTTSAGTVAIDVNANPAGTVIATASKTGYESGTTTVTANAPTPPPDTTPPVITAPADVTAEATGILTPVNIGTATATDLVDPTPAITSDAPASYPVGVTTVTWTATDDAGNSATATQTVTIKDTTAPSITAPAAVTAEATGTLTPVNIGTATATDLVDTTPAITNDAPASYPVGVTTVTWTATDDAGNSATATQTVTVTPAPVTDTTPPVITAPADVSVEAAPVLPMAVDIGMATATDNSGVPPVITNDAPALFGIGETIVTWTATDGSGNSATATQKVTVTAAQPSGTYTVTFEITDRNGNPVKNAEIELEGDLTEFSGKTNDAGKAIFTVASGAYSYEINKDGYREIEDIVIVTGDTTVSLVLVRGHNEEHVRTQRRSILHDLTSEKYAMEK